MAINVGTIFVDFEARNEQFLRQTMNVNRSLAATEGRAGRIAGAFDRSNRAARRFGRTLRGIGTAAAGLTVAAGAISLVARESANYGAELVELGLATGFTVEDIQLLTEVFAGDGVAAAATSVALQRLQRVLGDGIRGNRRATETFAELGINLDEVGTSSEDMFELMVQVADGLQQVGTQAERASIANALFGRAGIALLPILQRGGEDLRAQTQDFRRFGVVTAEQAASLKDLAQTYSDLERVARVALAQGVSEAADAIERFNSALAGRLPDLVPRLLDLASVTLRVVEFIVNNARTLIQVGAAYVGFQAGAAAGELLGGAGSILISPGRAGNLTSFGTISQRLLFSTSRNAQGVGALTGGIGGVAGAAFAAQVAGTLFDASTGFPSGTEEAEETLRQLRAERDELNQEIGFSNRSVEFLGRRVASLFPALQGVINTPEEELAELERRVQILDNIIAPIEAAIERSRQFREERPERQASTPGVDAPETNPIIEANRRSAQLATERIQANIRNNEQLARAAEFGEAEFLREQDRIRLSEEAQQRFDALITRRRAAFAEISNLESENDDENNEAIANLRTEITFIDQALDAEREREKNIDTKLDLLEMERIAQDRVGEALDRTARRAAFLQRAAQGVGAAFAQFAENVIINFEDVGEAARQLAREIASSLLRSLVFDPIAGAITSAVSGILNGTFGSNSSSGGSFFLGRPVGNIPTRADGGFTRGLTIVGERGPELADFGPAGAHIISNRDLASALRNGGQTMVFNFSPTINGTGADRDAIRQEVLRLYPVFEQRVRGSLVQDMGRRSDVSSAINRGRR